MNQFIENNFYQPTAPLEPVPVFVDIYEAHGTFSINAGNELQASLWATKNGEVVTANLGDANYLIYDKNNNPFGISQVSISPDANGAYKITPVSAILIQDLTHYLVKIGIVVDGFERVAYVGISLGEG